MIKSLPRYAAESINVDMSLAENQLRYLQHIDMAPKAEKEHLKVEIFDFEVLFPMKPY